MQPNLKRHLNRSVVVLAFITSALGFQNCAKTNFTGSAVQANAAGSTSSVSPSSVSGSPADPILGGTIDLSQVSQIIFDANVKTHLVGTYDFSSAITLDDTARTYNATIKATGPVSALTLVTCTASGSNVDFSALETALGQMTFKTTESSSSHIPDFGSMSLQFVLKDGSSQSFMIDNDTSSVSVKGVTFVNAASVVDVLEKMAHAQSCASGLPF